MFLYSQQVSQHPAIQEQVSPRPRQIDNPSYQSTVRWTPCSQVRRSFQLWEQLYLALVCAVRCKVRSRLSQHCKCAAWLRESRLRSASLCGLHKPFVTDVLVRADNPLGSPPRPDAAAHKGHDESISVSLSHTKSSSGVMVEGGGSEQSLRKISARSNLIDLQIFHIPPEDYCA